MMKIQERYHRRIAFGWLFIQLLLYTSSIVRTEQADNDIWRRSQISLVEDGYEGIVVAIHESVNQDDNLIDQIKDEMNAASENLYNATGGKFFRKVTILIPPSWNKFTYMDPSQATDQESYHKSHIRIRSTPEDYRDSYIDDGSEFSYYDGSEMNIDSTDQPEPFVLQLGGCGEESAFIGVTPMFFSSTSYWGKPAKVLVHLWGHFRWGLFDEYEHLPFDCTGDPQDKQLGSRCTNAIGTGYFIEEEVEGNVRFPRIALEEVCSSSDHIYQKVNTTLQGNIKGSIMSVGAHEQIVEFCGSDPQSSSSFHNGNAANRQNRMCRGKSSWEVMMQHVDFSNEELNDFSNEEMYDYQEPQFTLMVQKFKRTLVLTANGERLPSSCTTLTNDNECYILQSLALRESTEKVEIFLNETHYFIMDVNFLGVDDVISLTHSNFEISEILILESATDDLVNRMFSSSMKKDVGKYTFIGNDFRNVSECQTNGTFCKRSTLSEYLSTIHYDDVEDFVRVFSGKGTINETTEERNVTFILESALSENFPTLRLRWDKGNLNVSGLTITSRYDDRAEKMIEIRFEESLAENGESVLITLEKRGQERVNYDFEVFLKPTSAPVTVHPYLKSSSITLDDVSNITIYVSVTKLDKPIFGANVNAMICPPRGPCTEKTLNDSNAYEEFEDGIYSAVFDEFSDNGNYSIAVKAKGQSEKTKWNRKGLQPSGILPNVIDASILFEKPVALTETFERSPREIILQVNGQGMTTEVSSTNAETTHLPGTTSQITELFTEMSTELLSTNAETTHLPGTTSQTTELFTEMSTELLSTNAETTHLPGTTSQTTDLFTGMTTEVSSTNAETTHLPGTTSQITELFTEIVTELSSTNAETTHLPGTTSQTTDLFTEMSTKVSSTNAETSHHPATTSQTTELFTDSSTLSTSTLTHSEASTSGVSTTQPGTYSTAKTSETNSFTTTNLTTIQSTTIGETTTNILPTDMCANVWPCFVFPVSGVSLLVLIIYLMKQAVRMWRTLNYSLEKREKETLGSRTAEDAPQRGIHRNDIEMQNNAFSLNLT